MDPWSWDRQDHAPSGAAHRQGRTVFGRFHSRARADEGTGRTEARLWQAHEPYLHLVLDPERFPNVRKVTEEAGRDAGSEADHDFSSIPGSNGSSWASRTPSIAGHRPARQEDSEL